MWEASREKSDIVNATHATEIILVLLNSSILLTILMSLIFSAKNDLMFLESIAAVYNTTPLGAIRQYGVDIRNSILYLILGLILIVISTGYINPISLEVVVVSILSYCYQFHFP